MRSSASISEKAKSLRGFLRGLGQRALLSGLSLLVGLGICELGLRAFGVTYPVFDAYDSDRGIKLRPGKEGWYRKEGGAYLKINGLGYRDVDHAIEKPNDTYRIALLGDSYFEARQVHIDDTFWKILERELSGSALIDGRRVEILNFGIGGYGTAQELITFRLDAVRFHPDLVLLGFTAGNDVANNSRAVGGGGTFRPYFVRRGDQLVVDNSFRETSAQFLTRRSLLEAIHYSRVLELVNQARRIHRVRALQRKREQRGSSMVDPGLTEAIFAPPTGDLREAWSATEAILARLAAEVSDAGARFAVVAVSSPVQVDPDPGPREALQHLLGVGDLYYPERRLEDWGRRQDIPVITLAPRLARRAVAERIYFHGFENTVFGEGHWNEDGHAEVAELLLEDLQASGLLQGD